MRPAEVSAHFDPASEVSCGASIIWTWRWGNVVFLPYICEPSGYCPIVDLFSWFKYGCVIELTILA